MANNCVRFKVENTPYDEIDINANWVNMNVGYDEAKFTIDEDVLLYAAEYFYRAVMECLRSI